jgi:SAM-dependent methyltransferase
MNLTDFILSSKKPKAQPLPWQNRDFSRRSLQLHLDQSNDVNSRRDSIISRQVRWIHHEILKEKKSSVLDLGCGPGLYMEKLAKLGHHCTGIDISPEVIDYAKSKNFHECRYYCEDILRFTIDKSFDFVMLNFGWFNNFTKSHGNQLLKNIKKMLKPGGFLLLEILYLGATQDFGENLPQWHRAEQGIFSDTPYLFLQENQWINEEHRAEVTYYIIKPDKKIECYYQHYQGYEKDELCGMLGTHQLTDFQFFHDLFPEDDFNEDLFFLVSQKTM